MTTQNRATIVCLCGSTRFYREFMKANFTETMDGKIVLSVGFYPHAGEEMHGEKIGITPEQKEVLDKLHLQKVLLSDEILVLNVGGYVGKSTAEEIAYAHLIGRKVRWLETSCDEESQSRIIAASRALLQKALPKFDH